MPHRLGLSETVLIFKQHRNLFRSEAEFLSRLRDLKSELCEKKIIVEVENAEQALQLSRECIDGIQYDKFAVDQLRAIIGEIRQVNRQIVHLAAGGINLSNIADYAATGVDALVTTSVYFGKPIDIGTKIDRAD